MNGKQTLCTFYMAHPRRMISVLIFNMIKRLIDNVMDRVGLFFYNKQHSLQVGLAQIWRNSKGSSSLAWR